MKNTKHKFMYPGLILFLMVSVYPGDGWAQSKPVNKSGRAGLQQRIDFGNSYIMGQSIKSGAVYLLHRKQSEINSMLQYRRNYRAEILEDFKIRDHESGDQPQKAQNAAASGKSETRQ